MNLNLEVIKIFYKIKRLFTIKNNKDFQSGLSCSDSENNTCIKCSKHFSGCVYRKDNDETHYLYT